MINKSRKLRMYFIMKTSNLLSKIKNYSMF